jgi:adenylate cyclase
VAEWNDPPAARLRLMAAGPPPLTLVYRSGGEEHSFVLSGGETVTVGRGLESRLILPDPSVSRRHAELRPGDDGWTVVDCGSTNGVGVNGEAVKAAPLGPGDRLRLGSVEVEVRGAPAGWQPPPEADEADDLLNATIVRRLEDLPPGYLAGAAPPRPGKRALLDAAYSNEVFRYITRLAGELLRTDARDQVLRRVVDVAFEALPVDRGFVFLRSGGADGVGEGELVCELAREGEEVAVRPPAAAVPVSRTMLRAVVDRGVALVTPEAGDDLRLAGAQSVRLHGLRSALAAPLWSGERIVGALVLDTPSRAGSFTEQDLELATALANFAAVAIERIRHADRADRERRLRARLERYHSPSVVGEVLSGDEGRGLTRMKRAEVSVLFADLVGFTPLAETAEPEEVAALLSDYFNAAVEAIFAEGGTLDKFIGDGVMAFFGAPVAQPDHARRAVRAARAIQAAMARWNEERTASGVGPLAVRVAVHSGPVVVGEVGSERRVDYTVLGNTVNVAARLEEAVAGPGEVVVSEATVERLGDGPEVAVEPLGELPLKGMRNRVVAYRLLPIRRQDADGGVAGGSQ